MKKKKADPDVRWLDISCPTCGAGPMQGCLVFGRETMMKHRLKPHLSRVKESQAPPLKTEYGEPYV